MWEPQDKDSQSQRTSGEGTRSTSSGTSPREDAVRAKGERTRTNRLTGETGVTTADD